VSIKTNRVFGKNSWIFLFGVATIVLIFLLNKGYIIDRYFLGEHTLPILFGIATIIVVVLLNTVSIITRYVLREHVGPFLFGIATIIFVFMLNIVFRDFGRLLGKGLPVGVVIKFFGYNLAWIVALAIPMSVLVATLIAFGRLSSDHEITALKASGIHFYRLITPVLIIACFLTWGMELFNNLVLPRANHEVRRLYSGISMTRPTLTLEPNVFFNEIRNCSMLVREVNNKDNVLKGIIIHDNRDPKQSKIYTAESGRLEFSKEQKRMNFLLFNGETHEVDNETFEYYRKVKFEKHLVSIEVRDMVFEDRPSSYRGDREKSAEMMMEDIQKNEEAIRDRENRIMVTVKRDFDRIFPNSIWTEDIADSISFGPYSGKYWSIRGDQRVKSIFSQVQGEVRIIRGLKRAISSLKVEIYKKRSIPFACIIFVLIGAPLGIMARRKGFAIGGALSLAFFLVYWAFLIAGEQLADRMIIGPVMAMWGPNVIVGIFGIYLVIRTVRETTFIPWDRWQHRFLRIRGRE
jgi:lipopolysaccharide export system permease protein